MREDAESTEQGPSGAATIGRMMPIPITVVRDFWDRLALASTVIAAVLALLAIIVGVVAIRRGNSIARNADEALIRERRLTFELDVLARLANASARRGAGAVYEVRALIELLPGDELPGLRTTVERTTVEGGPLPDGADLLAAHWSEYAAAVDRRRHAAGLKNGPHWPDQALRAIYQWEWQPRHAKTPTWP